MESCCFHHCARFFCTSGSRGRRGLLLRVFFSRSRRDDSARLVSDPRTCGDEKHQSEWTLVLGDAGVHSSAVLVFVFIVQACCVCATHAVDDGK
jgi:hypothetical protein